MLLSTRQRPDKQPPLCFRLTRFFWILFIPSNGKTIGYFVYNQFATGPTGPDDHTYDNQVDAVFARFKTKGVTDLVLDFRYNPGGYVTAAQNLASSIGKGIDPSKIFYKKEYNKTLTSTV